MTHANASLTPEGRRRLAVLAVHQGDHVQAQRVVVMAAVLFACSALHAWARHRAFTRRAQRSFEDEARYAVALRERMDELS